MEDVSGTVCRMRSTVRKNQLSLEGMFLHNYNYAYAKLCNSVNGPAATLPFVGTISNPLEFFRNQSKDVSLSEGSRMLATLDVRALLAHVSSASAERAGSFLRKLGEFDILQLGEVAMEQNLFYFLSFERTLTRHVVA
jgi:hypothetical protein